MQPRVIGWWIEDVAVMQCQRRLAEIDQVFWCLARQATEHHDAELSQLCTVQRLRIRIHTRTQLYVQL